MSWKNLGLGKCPTVGHFLPVQSLIFGAAVAFVVWLLSPYLPASRHSNVPRDAAAAQIGARNHSRGEPYDVFGLRPGAQNLPDERR
jgi:hypothetical protein